MGTPARHRAATSLRRLTERLLLHEAGEEGIELWTTVSIRHEGTPGFAHGGILAAIFDNVIGRTMGRLHRVPAPTVQTDVTFVRPVPLDTEIVFRAELTGSEGRKRTVTASAWVGGTLHASAIGLLVVLREDQLAGGLRRPAGP